MKKVIFLLNTALIFFFGASSLYSEVALEPFTYSENFESGELNAWASYPLWQDTAFDPWIRTNTVVPGDPNISLEQTINAFWDEDTYAGMQKKFDMYMVPGSSITMRYYIKSHITAEFFTVRLAAGHDGKLDYTIKLPALNRWETVVITFNDFVRQNPRIAGKDRIKVNALAALTKIADADSKMKYFLGIDDVVFRGARIVAFQFTEPGVYRLSEWKPGIARNHYHRKWPI